MLKHVRASEGWNDKNIGQKGFTLIELLVVIIILGILAAVVVVAVNGLQDRGEENACNAERKAVEAAAAAYFGDNDVFPPGGSTELEDGTAPGDTIYIRDSAYTWDINADSGEAEDPTQKSGGPELPDDLAECGL